MSFRDSRRRRTVALAAAAIAAAVGAALLLLPRGADAYVVHRLVSDQGSAARVRDAALVNAWGLAASPTGPWWTANEARGASTLFAGDGNKQTLSVTVEGGPTGIAFNGGRELCRSRRRRVGARTVPLCVRGRDDPRLVARRSARLVGRRRRRRRRRRQGRDLPRPRDRDAPERVAAPLRNGLPQRPRRRVRRPLAPHHPSRRIRRPRYPVVVLAVRDPGRGRAGLRDVRVAGAGQRERLSEGRLRRRVRPRRTARLARRRPGAAQRALGAGARAGRVRSLRRRSPGRPTSAAARSMRTSVAGVRGRSKVSFPVAAASR